MSCGSSGSGQRMCQIAQPLRRQPSQLGKQRPSGLQSEQVQADLILSLSASARPQVGKHIAGACLDLDAFDDALGHLLTNSATLDKLSTWQGELQSSVCCSIN